MALSDGDEIRNLIGAYSQCVDDRRYEDIASLTTDDVVFDVHGAVYKGPAEFAQRLAANESPTRTGKHVTTNVVVAVDGDTATASSDFTYLARDGDGPLAPVTLGRYTDHFVRQDARWRFSSRTINRV
jgi:ketosteroid isomerase-like protein